MNKVQLIGRFTNDPELRYTQSNKPVSSFSIAVNKRINGENSVDYINCVAWNTTAEFINKYFKKGQSIALIGRLQSRSYEDDKGKHYITEVVVEETEFVGSKSEENKKTKDEEKEDIYKEFGNSLESDEDMPF